MRGDRSRSASIRAPRSAPSRTAPWVRRDSQRRRRSRLPAWRLSLRQYPVASQPSLSSPEQTVNASEGCGRPGHVGAAMGGGGVAGDGPSAGPDPRVLTTPSYLRLYASSAARTRSGPSDLPDPNAGRAEERRSGSGRPCLHDRSTPPPLANLADHRLPTVLDAASRASGIAGKSNPVACPFADRLRQPTRASRRREA